MKRPVVTAVFLFVIAGLAGCPIYDHENAGCYQDRDCGSSFVCNTQTGDCVAIDSARCTRPTDCDSTFTCTSEGICRSGDCSFSSCVAGYRCDSSSGIWQCVANGSGEAGSSAQAGEGGASAGQGGAAGQAAAASGAADMSLGGGGAARGG
jgi:hypothetical protein